MNLLLRSASVLGLLAAALAASAQVTAYTSLGFPPSSGGPTTVSPGIGGSPASLFTPSVSGTLSGLQVQVFQNDTNPVTFNVRLFADVPPTTAGGTDTVGAQLAAFTASTTYTNGAAATYPVAATGVPIVAGTRYWLGLDGGANVAWAAQSGAPATTVRAFGNYYAGGAPYGFTVQVNPVPEPSALAVLGLPALGLLRRRKRA